MFVVVVVVVVVLVVVLVDSGVGGIVGSVWCTLLIFQEIFSNKCFAKNTEYYYSRAKLTAVRNDCIQFFLPGALLDGQPIVALNNIFKTISKQKKVIFTF